MLTPQGVTDRLEDVERGAELGDREPDDVRVTVGVTCCALTDAERAGNSPADMPRSTSAGWGRSTATRSFARATTRPP